MLGVVALLSGIAYLFTPLTAAGPETRASAFDGQPALRLAGPGARAPCCWRSTPGSAASGSQPYAAGRARRPVPGRPGQRRRTTSGRATTWSAAILLAIFADRRPGRAGARPRAGASTGPRSPSARRLAIGLAVGIGWTQQRGLPRRPLPGRDRARRLPRGDPRGARVLQRGGPRGRPHRRRRRPPGLQAVRLLRRRPLQPRPVRRPPGPPRRLHADRDRSRGRRGRRGLRGVADGPQRRRLRLRRDRARPAHPGRSRRSRPPGPDADPGRRGSCCEDDLTFVFALDGELDPAERAAAPSRAKPGPG